MGCAGYLPLPFQIHSALSASAVPWEGIGSIDFLALWLQVELGQWGTPVECWKQRSEVRILFPESLSERLPRASCASPQGAHLETLKVFLCFGLSPFEFQ